MWEWNFINLAIVSPSKIVFQNGYINLHSPALKSMRILVALHYCQLGIVSITSPCHINVHVSDEDKLLFMCLLAILIFSFAKCLLKYFSHIHFCNIDVCSHTCTHTHTS